MLQAEWRKNILYFYEEDDVQRMHGTKIYLRNMQTEVD